MHLKNYYYYYYYYYYAEIKEISFQSQENN